MSDCVLCELRPTAHGAACSKCAGWLRRDLRAVPGLLIDLDITFSGRARLSGRVGARSSSTPLPFNALATERRVELERAVRLLAADAGIEALSAALTAQRAADRLPDLLRAPNLRAYRDNFAQALLAARRVIDRPRARRYLGPCDSSGTECVGSVYIYDGEKIPLCSTCKAEHDLSERTKWVLASTQDFIAPAGWISEHLRGVGKRVSTKLITKWASLGKLDARGVNEKSQPLYRVGDVADLHLASQARRLSPLERAVGRKLAK